jgi:hypothetical protein
MFRSIDGEIAALGDFVERRFNHKILRIATPLLFTTRKLLLLHLLEKVLIVAGRRAAVVELPHHGLHRSHNVGVHHGAAVLLHVLGDRAVHGGPLLLLLPGEVLGLRGDSLASKKPESRISTVALSAVHASAVRVAVLTRRHEM